MPSFARVEAKDTQTNHYTFPTLVVKLANFKLAGRVLDSDGKPVVGATVRLSGTGQQEWPTTKSDNEGKFVFDAVCEGAVKLSALWFDPASSHLVLSTKNSPGITVQADDTNIVLRLAAPGK